MSTYRNVPIDDIKIPKGRRQPTDERVASIARSIEEIGLLHPIVISVQNKLIAGLTRLKAGVQLGWTKIPCTILVLDELHAELAEIIENIERSNLSALEEAVALKRMKDIYLELHPGTGHGGDHTPQSERPSGKNGHLLTPTDARSYVEETAEKTGKAPRTVRRDVGIAEKLTDATKTQITGTTVEDSKAELERLAKLPPKDQEKVARAIGSGKAKTVAEGKKVAGVAGKPPATSEPASDAAKARAQIKIWADTIGRWLGQSPSIDEYRRQWPGKRGDNVVQHATVLYEALKLWQKEIK